MKNLIYFIFSVIILLIGCDDNPSDSINNSILSESKTVSKDFVFHRDSISNTDTLSVSLETSISDVNILLNFLKKQSTINSYSYSIVQIDTPFIPNILINVRPDYTEILWSTAYETNNRGFEIQRKDSNESYITVGFVNGAGTTTEPHQYSFKHYGNLAPLYFYRLKQINFDGTYEYALEVIIDVEATDSINVELFITADKGVIIHNGEIAPDSGYTYNLQFNPNDLIYFKNSANHFGKIRVLDFKFLNEHFLKLSELQKKLSFSIEYEIFLQTNGSRTFN